MMPILFAFGPIHIYSFSLFLILAWIICSFLFWKALKDEGTVEERIFDYMFLGTIAAFIGSRAGYVVSHFSLFSSEPLKIVALWVQPGLSFFSGILGAFLVYWLLTTKYRMKFGIVADALARSLPAAFLIGSIGSLLDGTEVGKTVSLPIAVSYVGHVATRHPVQLYLIISLIVSMLVLYILSRHAKKKKWQPGSLGLCFLLLFSLSFFSVEFFKDTHVYWGNLSINQWICMGLFCEGLGLLFVRLEGKKIVYKIGEVVKKTMTKHKKEDRERQSTQ